MRTRLVVQQAAAGSGAAGKLGFSSNTASAEAVKAFLTLGSQPSMGTCTLDASAAFLHSRLPRGERVLVRLPPDISWNAHEYQPVYADLYQALNGLRCASKAWLNMVREATSEHGLMTSPAESSVQMELRCGWQSCAMLMICLLCRRMQEHQMQFSIEFHHVEFHHLIIV